ncbi:oxygenase MpaB family protein [Verrucosispora sp. WMMA2121]|uniref:oxygenase MpaB family protein n=1 Tax=Verrucosispora sp. WMMA2121 TaxID=3015164 RepID=UPI0022B6EB39|nr:oxygenase MpaB family protein [Verrucosispora sp. WMMA2121]MCZ7423666.1 oxygenase MpaB family protein [Verrucosispora sp. WMMA2121]
MRARYTNLARIRALDPEHDYLAIYQTMLRYEFPWDMKLGLNLAFNRSFSIPSIAALHVATGELTERTQKRIDDTGLLMYEMVLNGFDQPRGREALRRVNHIHRPYDISNDDYLYVLGCLVVIPTRWLQRYGWRRPCWHERQATYRFYRELGRRMGILHIPDSYEAFEAWFDAHDAAHLKPNDDAAAIERATRMLMLTRIPKPFSRLGNALVSAMYDVPLRRATRVAAPAWPVRAGLHLALKTRSRLQRWFGATRTTPLFADGIKAKSYPDGYEISKLGPQNAHVPGRPGA